MHLSSRTSLLLLELEFELNELVPVRVGNLRGDSQVHYVTEALCYIELFLF